MSKEQLISDLGGEKGKDKINLTELSDNFIKERKNETIHFDEVYNSTPESRKVLLEGHKPAGAYNSIWSYLVGLRYRQGVGQELNQEQIDNALEALEVLKKIDDELAIAKTEGRPPDVKMIDRSMAEFIAKRFDQRLAALKRGDENIKDKSIDIEIISVIQGHIHSILDTGRFLNYDEISQAYPDSIEKLSGRPPLGDYRFKDFPSSFVKNRFDAAFREDV